MLEIFKVFNSGPQKCWGDPGSRLPSPNGKSVSNHQDFETCAGEAGTTPKIFRSEVEDGGGEFS